MQHQAPTASPCSGVAQVGRHCCRCSRCRQDRAAGRAAAAVRCDAAAERLLRAARALGAALQVTHMVLARGCGCRGARERL